MRIAYYYRHLNDPIGSGSHATSLVRRVDEGGQRGPLPPAAAGGRRSGGPVPVAEVAPARLAAVGRRHRLRYLQDDLRSTREAPRFLNHVRSWRPDVFIARHSDFDRTLDRMLDGVDAPSSQR